MRSDEFIIQVDGEPPFPVLVCTLCGNEDDIECATLDDVVDMSEMHRDECEARPSDNIQRPRKIRKHR